MGDKFTVCIISSCGYQVFIFVGFHCLVQSMFQDSIIVFSNKQFVSVYHFKWGIVRTNTKMSSYTG